MGTAQTIQRIPDLGMAKSLNLLFDMEWAIEVRQIRWALIQINSGEQQATDEEVWHLGSRLALHSAMFTDRHGSEPEYDVREQMK